MTLFIPGNDPRNVPSAQFGCTHSQKQLEDQRPPIHPMTNSRSPAIID
jgi:hypothetical protein